MTERHYTNCPNFEECPLCFKCRGHNTSFIKCQNCTIPKCTKKLHSPKNINMMISKQKVFISGKLNIRSGNVE